jgi:hypothetical protein
MMTITTSSSSSVKPRWVTLDGRIGAVGRRLEVLDRDGRKAYSISFLLAGRRAI